MPFSFNGDVYHSTLLGVILFGAYTPLYVGTMYISVVLPSSRNYAIISAITVLYAGSAYTTYMSLEFVLKESLNPFLSVQFGVNIATGVAFVPGIPQTVSLIIADGLLIWRCYRIWNSSPRVLMLCLGLYFAELVLYILQVVDDFTRTLYGLVKTANFSGSAYLVSLLQTVITTFLIAYRIYSSTKDNPMSKSKTRFNKILEILLQSAFLYTVSLLGCIVFSFVRLSYYNMQTFGGASFYALTVFPITVNIGPTLMVARVNLSRLNDNATIYNFTGIDYVGEETQRTTYEANPAVERGGELDI